MLGPAKGHLSSSLPVFAHLSMKSLQRVFIENAKKGLAAATPTMLGLELELKIDDQSTYTHVRYPHEKQSLNTGLIRLTGHDRLICEKTQLFDCFSAFSPRFW